MKEYDEHLEDPRLFFAAERTLLSWNRLIISLMIFGFVIERFGLFLRANDTSEFILWGMNASFILGELLVILASLISFYLTWQHIHLIRTIPKYEIPKGYNIYTGVVINSIIGFLGVIISVYLTLGY